MAQEVEQPSSFEKLKFAQELREYHHRALWEAERHYTWILWVILSAAFLVLNSDKTSPAVKFASGVGLAVLGALISFVAAKVVRRERRPFDLAIRVFLTEYNMCYPEDLREIDPRIGVDDASVIHAGLNLLRGRLSVRDAFQLLFGLFFVLFLVVGAVSAYLWVAVVINRWGHALWPWW